MSSNNIVIFPKGKKDSPPQTIEEIVNGVVEARVINVEILADNIMMNLMEHSLDEGFDLFKEGHSNNVTLIYEAIRSALFGTLDIKHPLHDYADFMNEEFPEDDDS